MAVYLVQEFLLGQTIFQKLETSTLPTNSVLFQEQVQKALLSLCNAALLVEQESLFSKNEELDDINTSSLQYILIAYYIGELHLKVVDPNRFEHATRAMSSFKEFLDVAKRLRLVAKQALESLDYDTQPNPTSRRAELIARVKREKEIKAQLEAIVNRKAANTSKEHEVDEDEELDRKQILLWIDLCIQKAISQLELTEKELKVLSFVSSNPPPMHASNPLSNTKPPEIYTILPGGRRVDLAKQVFRPGYNLATITPEEAAEAEMRSGRMLKGPGGAASEKKGSDSGGEDEDIDNEEKLCKARHWDDFKDDNPRGWGNTKR